MFIKIKRILSVSLSAQVAICTKPTVGGCSLAALFSLFFILSSCVTTPIQQEISKDLEVTEVAIGSAEIEYNPESPTLDGYWRSPYPERAGNGRYSIREYKFNQDQWEFTYTLASDKKMNKVLYVHKAKGSFIIQNQSKRLPGTYLVAYKPTHKTIQVNFSDKKTIKEFGLEDCPLKLQSEVDIATTGCGYFPKIKDCSVDFDLIRQSKDRNKIEIGDRFAEFNSCTEDKRPIALGFTLEKVEK